jgi:hypothetical protein
MEALMQKRDLKSVGMNQEANDEAMVNQEDLLSEVRR